MSRAGKIPAFSGTGFWLLRWLLDFWILVYEKDWKITIHKFPARKNILYTVLPVTSFSVNYNKTQIMIRYEIKYDPDKIAQKNKF